MALTPNFGAVALGVGAHVLQHRADVGKRGRLAGVAAREGEVAFEHLAHLVDVLLQEFDVRRIVDERQATA